MATLETVLSLLDLESLEEDLFRGRSPQEEQQRVFGGQVAGQALLAAGRTVHGRSVHSLHAYFLRPGDPKVPILYKVERMRDGGSFSTRRVTAIQHGRAIFALSASFQVPERATIDRGEPMPTAPDPESLPTIQERIAAFDGPVDEGDLAWFQREQAIDMRHVDATEYLTKQDKEPHSLCWIRTTKPIDSADPLLHQCLIAYASDMTLIDTSMRPHLSQLAKAELQVASLDHTMWFHRPFRADEWLLYAQESPNMSSSRGLTTARLYRQSGELVVSVAQEGLVRVRSAERGRPERSS